MPESSLAMSYDDIRRRVGDLRGYGTDIEDWEDEQKERVEYCLRDGAASFYLHAHHEWSFLSPEKTVTIADATNEMELPWDFNFPTDDIYFDDNWGRILRIGNDGEVFLKRQYDSTSTGRPVIAAVVADGGPTMKHGQTKKLIFWPIADADYSVQLRYSAAPHALSPSNPYPYGGAANAQTIMEACLAASERLDGAGGRHSQEYPAMLENAKANDRRIKPRIIRNKARKTVFYGPRNVVPVVYTHGV